MGRICINCAHTNPFRKQVLWSRLPCLAVTVQIPANGMGHGSVDCRRAQRTAPLAAGRRGHSRSDWGCPQDEPDWGEKVVRSWLRFYAVKTHQNATKCVNLRKWRFAITCSKQRTSGGFGLRRSGASQAGRRPTRMTELCAPRIAFHRDGDLHPPSPSPRSAVCKTAGRDP